MAQTQRNIQLSAYGSNAEIKAKLQLIGYNKISINEKDNIYQTQIKSKPFLRTNS